MEQWRDIPGYEGRYQVSDQGRVKSLPFKQRYLLRTGVEAYRTTPERILAQQKQNSGYMLVHLHLDNKRKACTVHRLVALAFVPGRALTVNHKSGIKTDNRAENLEWSSYTENHLHAVRLRLNKQALPVETDGVLFPSAAQASRASCIATGTILRSAKRGIPDAYGNQWRFV